MFTYSPSIHQGSQSDRIYQIRIYQITIIVEMIHVNKLLTPGATNMV